MNYQYLAIGFFVLAAGILIPLQVYKIRQRRLNEQTNIHQHIDQEDHSCCSCH